MNAQELSWGVSFGWMWTMDGKTGWGWLVAWDPKTGVLYTYNRLLKEKLPLGVFKTREEVDVVMGEWDNPKCSCFHNLSKLIQRIHQLEKIVVVIEDGIAACNHANVLIIDKDSLIDGVCPYCGGRNTNTTVCLTCNVDWAKWTPADGLPESQGGTHDDHA